MPILKLTVQPARQDLGDIESGYLYDTSNVVYASGYFAPIPGFIGGAAITSGGGAVTDPINHIGGLHIHRPSTNSLAWRLYIGTNNYLLRSTAEKSSTMTNAVAAVMNGAFDDPIGWQFTSFGDQIWATNGNFTTGGGDNIKYASTPTTNFVNGPDPNVPTANIGYNPRAKFISTTKNHIVIANCYIAAAPAAGGALTAATAYPSLVMLSATDRPRQWGSPADTPEPEYIGADYQDLQDNYGPITALFGGDYTLIFKANCIYRMEGAMESIRQIAVGEGTLFPNAIVRYGDDVYFWGPSGPSRLIGGSGAVERLTLGKIHYSICDNYNSFIDVENRYANILITALIKPRLLSAFVDHNNGLIVWTAGTNGGVVYDVDSGEFSAFADNIVNHNAKSISQYGIDGSGRLFQNSFSVGQYNTETGGAVRVLIRSALTQSYKTDGTGRAAPDIYFRWPYIPLGFNQNDNELRRTRITAVRPLFTAQAGDGFLTAVEYWLDIDLTLRTKSRFPDNEHRIVKQYRPYSDAFQEENGWITIDEAPFGTHHSLAVKFADSEVISSPYADFAVIQFFRNFRGLEVMFEYDGGDSGGGFRA